MVTLHEVNFGIEIETVGQTRAVVAQAICSVVGGHVVHVARPECYDPYECREPSGRIWKVVADSSLANVPFELRAEIVSPILRYDEILTLQDIVRAVRIIGSSCDETTGIHLHLSHPDVTPKALANLAKIIYKQEELIYAALGVTQARMERYCRPLDPGFIEKITRNPPKTFRQLNIQWYGQYEENPIRHHASRYAILNLNAFFLRGAVEIRAYAGSLHAGKVKAAIQFGMALFTKAMNTYGASVIKRRYDPQSARYDFRVFLIGALNMNGDEFKTARKHLLALMPGDSAYKYGALQRKHPEKKTTDTTTKAGAERLQPSS